MFLLLSVLSTTPGLCFSFFPTEFSSLLQTISTGGGGVAGVATGGTGGVAIGTGGGGAGIGTGIGTAGTGLGINTYFAFDLRLSQVWVIFKSIEL